MVSSQQIGEQHERRVEELLRMWEVTFRPKEKFKTNQSSEIELDFWLPPLGDRPAIVIECKTFGVAAKSIADSRRRKAQEALYLLVQVRRHCPDRQRSRIIIVTGKEGFLPEQVKLLHSELGPDFHVVSVETPDSLRHLLRLSSEPKKIEPHTESK